MAKGRKPQSAVIYELKGSYGNHKERLGGREESPPIARQAPDYLGLHKAERELWTNLVDTWWWLPQCTEVALGELCKLMVQSKKLKREYDAAIRRGEIKIVQVLGRNLRMCRNDIKDYLIQFGVTPSERTRFLRQQTDKKARKKSMIS